MSLQGSWLIRGYFDLSKEDARHSTTQMIRDELEVALGNAPGTLRIVNYPVGPAWRHMFWWREGTKDYAEAQFFARIAHHYPILSLGISIEKGREGPGAAAGPKGESGRMDRATWDWQRLALGRKKLLDVDVPATAAALGRPIYVWTRTRPPGPPAKSGMKTFSYHAGEWFERRRGQTDTKTIAAYLQTLDGLTDRWVELYFAVDLDPTAADGLTPTDVAGLLMAFSPVRRRLRP
jgi:hypothetical protein